MLKKQKSNTSSVGTDSEHDAIIYATKFEKGIDIGI